MALPAHHPTSCKDHPSCPDPRYLQRGLSFLCVWLLELADHFLACTHSVLPFYLTHCAARAAGAGGCPRPGPQPGLIPYTTCIGPRESLCLSPRPSFRGKVPAAITKSLGGSQNMSFPLYYQWILLSLDTERPVLVTSVSLLSSK